LESSSPLARSGLLNKSLKLSSGIDLGLMGHLQQLQNDEGLILVLVGVVDSADVIHGGRGAWVAGQAPRSWGDGPQRAIK
jgi:hypothetical protein